ncbi:hypothetical protein, partial [Synechococcus sp. CCY 0621]|uniref:hypothetical protein n=1 Tax=Synechococcus sp. CCY 0621 TaxID=2815603 RepID=UPI001C217618
NWNWVSSGAVFGTTTTQGQQAQQQFMVDANGTPITSAPQNASTDRVDPIIGGGTSLAPVAVDDFGELLPADPTFTTTPFLALGELSSLGQSNPTDLLASPFPSAGSASSPTTPWLLATQPLL